MSTLLAKLVKEADKQNMVFQDFLYYKIKESDQEYDFWYEKAFQKVRGAKVKFRNIKKQNQELTALYYNLYQ